MLLFKILMTLSDGQYWYSENLPYQRMSCFTRWNWRFRAVFCSPVWASVKN